MSALNISTIEERLALLLASLAEDVEPDEEAPTEAAQAALRRLLVEGAAQTEDGLPFRFPAISTSGQGELSCQWRCEEKTVLLLVGPEGQSALHWMRLKNRRVVQTHSTPEPGPGEIAEVMRCLQLR